MILKSLTLNQFRNYREGVFSFSNHINVIVGPNAQGKTNLLEGIFFLSRGYAHRTASRGELVGFEGDGFYLKGAVYKDQVDHRLSIKYQNKKKLLTLNGNHESRQEALTQVLSVILFEPEDLRIVKAGPEKRRRFINEEIGGYLPNYTHVLKNYRKVLAQRNALLKEIKYSPSLAATLDTWDDQLVYYGTRLMEYRLDYLKRLNVNAKKLHREMSAGQEVLGLFYQNNIIDDLRQATTMGATFRDKVKESREADILRGSTTVGPHVDDILIEINKRDARKYASQGQQRTAAISLKLSQIEIYKESTGDYPIVLLDDILSELDGVRQEKILSILGKTQAFITCTDDSFASRYPKDAIKTFHILEGQIERK